MCPPLRRRPLPPRGLRVGPGQCSCVNRVCPGAAAREGAGQQPGVRSPLWTRGFSGHWRQGAEGRPAGQAWGWHEQPTCSTQAVGGWELLRPGPDPWPPASQARAMALTSSLREGSVLALAGPWGGGGRGQAAGVPRANPSPQAAFTGRCPGPGPPGSEPACCYCCSVLGKGRSLPSAPLHPHTWEPQPCRVFSAELSRNPPRRSRTRERAIHHERRRFHLPGQRRGKQAKRMQEGPPHLHPASAHPPHENSQPFYGNFTAKSLNVIIIIISLLEIV